MDYGEDVKGLVKYWDEVAYGKVIPAVESGDYETAENETARLVEIDARILKAINNVENVVGE